MTAFNLMLALLILAALALAALTVAVREAVLDARVRRIHRDWAAEGVFCAEDPAPLVYTRSCSAIVFDGDMDPRRDKKFHQAAVRVQNQETKPPSARSVPPRSNESVLHRAGIGRLFRSRNNDVCLGSVPDNNAHEDLLTVDGQVLVTPDSVTKTVSEPTDTRPYRHVGESAEAAPAPSALEGDGGSLGVVSPHDIRVKYFSPEFLVEAGDDK